MTWTKKSSPNRESRNPIGQTSWSCRHPPRVPNVRSLWILLYPAKYNPLPESSLSSTNNLSLSSILQTHATSQKNYPGISLSLTANQRPNILDSCDSGSNMKTGSAFLVILGASLLVFALEAKTLDPYKVRPCMPLPLYVYICVYICMHVQIEVHVCIELVSVCASSVFLVSRFNL